MFRSYDSDNRGWLERADTVGALSELGLLQGISSKVLGTPTWMSPTMLSACYSTRHRAFS